MTTGISRSGGREFKPPRETLDSAINVKALETFI